MCNRFVLFLFCLFVNGILGKIEIHNCASTILARDSIATSYRLCILVDAKTDPCEDFYKFSCGNYIDHKKLIENKSFSITSDVASLNRQHLKHLVKHHASHTDSSARFEIKLATDLYKSCMNREKLGLEPMRRLLKQYGGWPVVEGETWLGTNWIELIKTLLYEGFNITPFLTVKYKRVSNDDSIKGTPISWGPPTFTVDNDKLLSNRDVYLELMVELAVQFGARRSDAEKEMEEVLSFMVKIASKYDQPNDTEVLTIAEIKNRFPLVMAYMEPIVALYDPNLKIVVERLEYFRQLQFIFNESKIRIIGNYLVWRAVMAAASSELLIDEVYQRVVAFNQWINGEEYTVNPLPYLENKCSRYVLKLLPWAADSIYIQDKINLIKNVEAPIMQIKINIKNELIKMIEESTWIDNKAKEGTISKLKLLDFFVGHPNPTENVNYFNLQLDSENFLQNFLNIKQFDRNYPHVSRMSSWEVNARYSMTSWDVNAQCKASDGGIYIPVGALQWPLFSSDAPSYFNYGALGSIIGREFGHAIDVEWHKLDAHGISYDWLNSTEDMYLSRVGCFIRQYSQMETETGDKLNGEKTINEDISDHLGLKAAYNAYVNLKSSTQLLSAQYNFTHRQLFWVSMAQSHCGYTDPSQYPKIISESRQSLNPFRIWGMIKNMPEFAKDFGCSRIGKMYEGMEDRCELL